MPPLPETSFGCGARTKAVGQHRPGVFRLQPVPDGFKVSVFASQHRALPEAVHLGTFLHAGDMPAAGKLIGNSPVNNEQDGYGAELKSAEVLFLNQSPDKRLVFRCGMAAASAP
jgi:hypothetical protein